MAIFNEILVGRYNRALQKLFGIKGSPPVRQVAGEISPNISMFYGAEMRYLEGWARYGIGFQLLPVVGQNAVVRVRNPANSNVIAVFEKIAVGLTVADPGADLRHGATVVDLLTIIGPPNIGRFDNRPQGQNPTMIVSQGTAAPGIGATIAVTAVVAGAAELDFIFDSVHELTVLPGDAVQFQSSVVNVRLLYTFWWRERFLEESERT